jgi:hypothetical protein
VQVQPHHAGNVRAIDGGDNPFAASQRAEFLGGQTTPEKVLMWLKNRTRVRGCWRR